MAAQEDCCLVCAEPLEWTAFGPCGHKDVCSKCVARLRFVLKDKRCVLCQQEFDSLFFTQYAGDYTARLAPEQFKDLKTRADRKELFYLPEVEGYFDDSRHFQDLKALCGYTHPVLEAPAPSGGPPQPLRFNNLTALKKHIEATHKQQFCDICLKGRKVFISEQLLYTKEGLKRHHDCGDETGPMAESGFKGHPLCKFCRTRFYDSNELYRHMESNHEHCFLCRRATPDKYVYYRHYKELEEHFNKAHHLCPHPTCLEKHFVVFNTDYELKAHFAAEHGDEMKMSAAQRRQALTIPIQLQFRSEDDPQAAGPSRREERAATVIGGGYNYHPSGRGRQQQQQQQQRGGGYGSGMHHSRSEPQLASDGAGDTVGGDHDLSSVAFTAEDFPVVSGQSSSAVGPMGLWAAFTNTAHTGAGGLSDAEFPALPSLSKAQRKRLKEQQNKSLADRLAAAAQPPRVIHRGSASGAGPSSSAAATAAPPSAADFPSLGAAPSSAAAASADPGPSSSAASLLGFGAAVSAGGGSSSSSGPLFGARGAVAVAAQRTAAPPTLGGQDFPSLGGGGGSGGAGNASGRPGYVFGQRSGSAQSLSALVSSSNSAATSSSSFLSPRSGPAPANSGWQTVPGGSSSASSAAPPPPPQAPPAPEDFPSLPPGSGKPKRGLLSAAKRTGGANQRQASSASSQPDAGQQSTIATAAAGSGGGPSEALKACNRALVDKIKRQLADDSAFSSFKQHSGQFMRGEVDAERFHATMVKLGLLNVTAELAALCPASERRAALLAAHNAFLATPAAADPSRVGRGWVPPEAARAQAENAARCSSWECARCTLVNAPGVEFCEACALAKAKSDAMEAAGLGASSSRPNGSGTNMATSSSNRPTDDYPSLSSRPSAGGPSTSMSASGSVKDEDGGEDGAAGGSGGKGKKKGKQTAIRIGIPAQASPQPAAQQHKVNPRNVWTQEHPLKKQQAAAAAGLGGAAATPSNVGPAAPKQPNMWKGSAAGKIAKAQSAINDAWSKP